MNRAVSRALEAFAKCETVADYNSAKRLAGRCDRLFQLAMVNSIIAAGKRVRSAGKRVRS